MNLLANLAIGQEPDTTEVFTSSGTFVVPDGITSVSVCMVGGGASGDNWTVKGTHQYARGGQAGTVVTNSSVTVTPGENITVTVGAGGAGKFYNRVSGDYNGASGGDSIFDAASGTITASGGSGDHSGNSASTSNCYGTANDGSKSDNIYSTYNQDCYGGEAGFGNGGNGSYLGETSRGGAGGVGAGGGAKIGYYTSLRYSDAGGRGEVRISWS